MKTLLIVTSLLFSMSSFAMSLEFSGESAKEFFQKLPASSEYMTTNGSIKRVTIGNTMSDNGYAFCWIYSKASHRKVKSKCFANSLKLPTEISFDSNNFTHNDLEVDSLNGGVKLKKDSIEREFKRKLYALKLTTKILEKDLIDLQ